MNGEWSTREGHGVKGNGVICPLLGSSTGAGEGVGVGLGVGDGVGVAVGDGVGVGVGVTEAPQVLYRIIAYGVAISSFPSPSRSSTAT